MMAKVRKYIFEEGCNGSSRYELVDVKVGDWVGFKSDHEQSGQIVEINHVRSWDGRQRATLTLENKNGFGGDYLRYATRTTEDSEDCWID